MNLNFEKAWFRFFLCNLDKTLLFTNSHNILTKNQHLETTQQ
jgi:hypothetical protein